MEPPTFLVVFMVVFVLATLLLGPVYFFRVDRAHELLARGSPLVDVDRPEVFFQKHPIGAINIPLEDLARLSSALDKTEVVIVHGHWLRAFIAARELRARGFQVLNLGSAWT
jgi:rhodanese-related sulfurtransferase